MTPSSMIERGGEDEVTTPLRGSVADPGTSIDALETLQFSIPVGDVIDGSVYMTPTPFVRDIGSRAGDDPEGAPTLYFMTWVPGVRFEYVPPDDSESIADGIGYQILTVVSVHKPGRFPSRVFYTRRWKDPAGHEFGKGNLRIKTLDAFKRLARGWRHDFRMATGEEFLAYDAKKRAEIETYRAVLSKPERR